MYVHNNLRSTLDL